MWAGIASVACHLSLTVRASAAQSTERAGFVMRAWQANHAIGLHIPMTTIAANLASSLDLSMSAIIAYRA